MTRILGIVLAMLLASCGALVEGGGTDVVTGHVTEGLENGNRTPLGSGMPQPFLRLRVQLDQSLYREECSNDPQEPPF